MEDTEITQVNDELQKFWEKLSIQERANICEFLSRYQLGDVLNALREHKLTSKFAPTVADLNTRLRGRPVESRGEDEARAMSFADTIRRLLNHPEWHDYEAILRWFHAQWHSKRIAKQDVHCFALAAKREQYRETLKRRCAYALCAAGCMESEDGKVFGAGADRTALNLAEFIFGEDRSVFEMGVAEAKSSAPIGGLSREPVDHFA